MSTEDDKNTKTEEKEKFRLAGPSAVPVAPPPSVLIGNNKNDEKKSSVKGVAENTSFAIAPGAFAVSGMAPSRGETTTMRSKSSGEAKATHQAYGGRNDGGTDGSPPNSDDPQIENKKSHPKGAESVDELDNGKSKSLLRLASPTASASDGALLVDERRASTERTERGDEKFSNLLRLAPATSSDGAPWDQNTVPSPTSGNNNDGNDEAPQTTLEDAPADNDIIEDPPTSLLQAEIAEDVDVDAIVNERLRQMDVGVAATVRVPRERETDEEDDDDDQSDNSDGKSPMRPMIILLGVLVFTGAVVAGIILSRPSSNDDEAQLARVNTGSPTHQVPTTPSPTQVPTIPPRPDKVKAILADFAPWNDEAIIWLGTFDTWEPSDIGDPNMNEYLWLERYVMAELYFTTNGAGWKRNDNWLSQEPVCSWYFREGVINECPGPIKDLVLSGNRLTSSVPASIGNLIQLTRLDLDNNRLTSSIPSSIGNLIHLGYLSINRNRQLTSSIPSSIGNLTLLTHLALDWNGLTSSIPSSIGNLTLLTSLNLDDNKLTSSIPSSIGDLTELRYFSICDNQLTSSIPSSIGNLTQLEYLNLNDNQLTSSIPSSIGNLSQLAILDLARNQLAIAIPSSIGDLTQLSRLALYLNQLTTSIPSSIGNLKQLTRLALYNNQLTSSIPESIGNLNQLTYLSLADNDLASSIPSSIGQLTQLEVLFLGDNELTSSIPSSIGNLTQLISLDLGDNQLKGIPRSIGTLTQLTRLDLARNQLSSSIPSSIGKLTRLEVLWLNSNQLTSSIPSSIGNLTKLGSLALDDNKLSGSIPSLPSSIAGFACRLGNNCFLDISNGESEGCNVTSNCT